MDSQKVSFDRSKTNNQALLKWLDKMIEMCDPKEVRWCDGSDQEWEELCGLMTVSYTHLTLPTKA